MNEYLLTLVNNFREESNPVIAAQQKSYMRDQFEFCGLKAPMRREIQKPFLDSNHLPDKSELFRLVKTLWSLPEREFQLFALDLSFCYIKNLEPDDLHIYRYMVTHKSWWDTVDFTATNLMGKYFQRYSADKEDFVEHSLKSNDMWLQRSALLFQLKYKDALDTELLSHTIHQLADSNEFFIKKAIGWVLREYGKTNPEWVVEFTETNKDKLSLLSQREALRIIKS